MGVNHVHAGPARNAGLIVLPGCWIRDIIGRLAAVITWLNKSKGSGMRGVLNIIIGLVFVVGGLSGNLAFRGTQSGGLLAVVGVGLIGLGVYRMVKKA